MNQKGFANLIVISLIIVVLSVAGYFVLIRKPTTPDKTQQPISSETTVIPTPTSIQPVPSNDFKTYILKGNAIISHNALVVFPLDLEKESPKFVEMGPNTIIEVQAKSACAHNRVEHEDDEVLTESHALIRNLNSQGMKPRDVANIRKISVVMPYNTSLDSYTRIPGTFCIGFHTSDNKWIWNFTAIRPTLNDDLKKGFGEMMLDAKNVDIVAILFDDTTAIETITFEAEKVR